MSLLNFNALRTFPHISYALIRQMHSIISWKLTKNETNEWVQSQINEIKF